MGHRCRGCEIMGLAFAIAGGCCSLGACCGVWCMPIICECMFNWLIKYGPTCATAGPVHRFNNLNTKYWWFSTKDSTKSLAQKSLPGSFYLWHDLHPCILGKVYFFFQYFLWAWIFKGKSGKEEAALSLSTTSTRTWTLQHLVGFMHLKWRTGRIQHQLR